MSRRRFRLVDICCGAGGAAIGYARVGFKITGIDNKPQPHYPFDFKQADALAIELPEADAYHASPPCQLFTVATKRYRNKGHEYPDVLNPLRKKLLATGKPFVIENVPGSPLRKDLVICGEMFGLRVIRHRVFELHGFKIEQPPHPEHRGYATGIKDRFAYKAVVNESPDRNDLYYYTVCGHGRRERETGWRIGMQPWASLT